VIGLIERPTVRFELPARLEAAGPPEARGLARDDVRLLVSSGPGAHVHVRFRDLPRVLDPGDVLVVNRSATMAAELDVLRPGAPRLVVHLSTPLPDGRWLVELRRSTDKTTVPLDTTPDVAELPLAGGGRLRLHERFAGSRRLWLADLDLGAPVPRYLARHGRPIRYSYVDQPLPLGAYQTVYASEPGSAEMPSAGRPFTAELLTRLVAKGVVVAPLVLHTGVSSLEGHEPPYPEWASVPAATAELVEHAHRHRHRVVAVGTTVVRALETAAEATGTVRPWEGWTDLVVTPERGVRAVDGLLTGWHEPEASHLLMLEAVAGTGLVQEAYGEALDAGYLWHEFGDVHLLLPGATPPLP
jgi:S-adenosylmethionine:tRNA ribosyltransferase-isomerase